MSIRKAIISTCIIAGAWAAPALADVDVDVTTAPPALREEQTPPAKTGYVWATGYWAWENGQYNWHPGHWIEAKVSSHWVPEHWEKLDATHWRFKSGHWESD